jgi:hypothetical protein
MRVRARTLEAAGAAALRDRTELAAPGRAVAVSKSELAPGVLALSARPGGASQPRTSLDPSDLRVLRGLAARLGQVRAGSVAEQRMLEAVGELVALDRWVQNAVAAVRRG